MLSVVKVLGVGGHALNSLGNYIVDHGKSWKNHGICVFEFLWEPFHQDLHCLTRVKQKYQGLILKF